DAARGPPPRRLQAPRDRAPRHARERARGEGEGDRRDGTRPRGSTRVTNRRGRGEGSVHPHKGGWRATVELGPDPVTGARVRSEVWRKKKSDVLVEHAKRLANP